MFGSHENQGLSPARASRRHERGRFAGTAHLLLPERRIVQVRTLELGLSSLVLVAKASLPMKVTCGVKLSLPRASQGVVHTLMAEGEVTGSLFNGKEDGFLTGLRFTRLLPEAQTLIEQYLLEVGVMAPKSAPTPIVVVPPYYRNRYCG